MKNDCFSLRLVKKKMVVIQSLSNIQRRRSGFKSGGTGHQFTYAYVYNIYIYIYIYIYILYFI